MEQTGQPTLDRASRWGDAGAVAVALGAAGVVVYRALAWPISHDEALTYLHYVSGGWASLLRFGANNHVLFSWLAWVSVRALGPSVASLRLPTLLAAGVYLLCAVSLARRLFAPAWRPVVVALLSLNPLVLDYLVAARGYGLALMFLLLAERLLLLETATPTTSSTGGVRRRCRAISWCCGFAVAANLSFAVPAAAVGVTAAWVFARPRNRWSACFNLVAPGLLAVLLILGPYLIQARSGQFYLGYATARDSARDLYNASFHHDASAETTLADVVRNAPPRVGSRGDVIAFFAITLLVVLGLLGGQSLRGRTNGAALTAAFAVPLLSIGAAALLHAVLAVPLPVARTLVYLPPTVALAVLLGVARGSGWWRWGTALAALAVTVVYARQLGVGGFHYARYDAGSAALFHAVVADAALHRPGLPVRVGCDWIYEPSLNFYRVVRRASDWVPIDRHDPATPAGFDYFVCDATAHPALVNAHAPVVEQAGGTSAYRVTRDGR